MWIQADALSISQMQKYSQQDLQRKDVINPGDDACNQEGCCIYTEEKL
jgi:hypothetical protein